MLETLRSGRLSLGPAAARVRGGARRLARRAARLGGLERHRRASPRDPRGRHRAPATRCVTTPFSFVASANCLLYEGARPVFCDIDPRTLNIDPRRGRGGGHRAHDRPAAGAHLRLPGRHAGLRARWRAERGLWIVEDACEALGAVHADGTRRRRARQPGGVRLLPEQADDDRRGRRGGLPDAAVKERIDSERNQGRAPDMGWLDHDRLGFNYRLVGPRLRARHRPARAPRRDARRPRARGGALHRGARGHRGPRPALPRRGRRPRAAGSSTWSSCRRAWTATPPIDGAARRAASTRSPTCRRST